MSRKCVRVLAGMKVPDVGPEDRIFSQLVRQFGFRVRTTDRLRAGCEVVPQASNDQVSAHWCTPGLMTFIHKYFVSGWPETRRLKAVHPSWQGELTFFPNGAFFGGGMNPNGAWRISADGRTLDICWKHWTRDVLVRNPEGYSNGTLNIIGLLPGAWQNIECESAIPL